MTLNHKISQLPSEQLSWLLLIKDIFKRTLNSNIEEKKELIDAIEKKAIERGYGQIGEMIDTNELEEYFKN
ncbi:MAG: hypothetical protein ABFR05_11730 [Bacteroidota bacterium]